MQEVEKRWRSPLWKRFLGWMGGTFLGGVLLIAGWAKAIDPEAFTEQVRLEGLEGLLSAPTVAFIALGLEFALGIALLLNLRRLWVLVPATLLVAFLVFLTGRSYWNFSHGIVDETAGCGCFGNLVDRTPAEAFWQDLLLLVPPLFLVFVGGAAGGSFPKARISVVALFTAVALVFAWRAPELPLDDLATRLHPGVLAEDLCAGRGGERICLDTVVPELAEDEHMVVLAELTDPVLGEAVAQLNELALRTEGPRLWVLTSSAPEEHHRFFFQWGPVFEIREAPPSLLRPLYRRLPRTFALSDGEVVETFPGLPPGVSASPGAPAETT